MATTDAMLRGNSLRPRLLIEAEFCRTSVSRGVLSVYGGLNIIYERSKYFRSIKNEPSKYITCQACTLDKIFVFPTSLFQEYGHCIGCWSSTKKALSL